MAQTRIERDSMGEMEVPADALYGASTQRAVLNFPISSYRFGRHFIQAMGEVKYACAMANEKLGKLDPSIAAPIKQAAKEVVDGKLDDQFVVDVFQTGSGTSTNMNANEVIANRAIQITGGELGSKRIHPNDHVNMGQSSNDVIPTVMHVAAVHALHTELMPALHRLRAALDEKAKAWDDVVKIGRTHLQDATPIRLGQVFSGYASQIAHADRRVMSKVIVLRELPIGGTAVGTGINTHPDFGRMVCEILNHETSESFHEAQNHFEAQHSKDNFIGTSAVIRTVTISLAKIANDIRFMASGPRSGIGELLIPAVQPGSSIMPGKVNPVICESMLQICAQVIGYDATIAWAGSMLGNFELHVGMPVMANAMLESVSLLHAGCDMFVEKCIQGLEPNRERCAELIEGSLAMCTSLAPELGYDKAAEIAKIAYETGKTVREIAVEQSGLDAAKLDQLLDPMKMTGPSA
jgi:fumarate hydratase class II